MKVQRLKGGVRNPEAARKKFYNQGHHLSQWSCGIFGH